MRELTVTFGPDMFNFPSAADQVQQMDPLSQGFEPIEFLNMATGNAKELLAMSGVKTPYPEGSFGTIEESAHADLLILGGTRARTSRYRATWTI